MTDVNKVLADLTATFEQFKAANDERLAAKADVVTEEKVDKINAAVSDMQAKVEEAQKAAKAAAEAESRMDEMEKTFSRIKMGGGKDDDRDMKAEASVFFAGKAGVERAEIDSAKVDAYAKYSEGFSGFLARGDRLADVQAAMQVGSDPDGGYWVPTQMTNDIKRRLFETSPIRPLASALTITTDSVSFPTDTNDATVGGWVGETTSRAETATAQIGEQKIYVREQYAEPRVTQKLLDMATINVDAWLSGKIADKLARTENTAFVNGTGVDQPRGFMSYSSAAVTTADASRAWGAMQYVATGTSAGFPTVSGVPSASDPDTVLDLIAAMNPAYLPGAVFAMSRATQAAFRKMRDGDGRYLVEFGNLEAGATGFSLFGYNIVTMEDIAAIGADSFSVAFANFGVGYQIVDGRGIRVLRDPYTAKPYVKFYTTKWTGGDVVNFDAIKLLKFGTS